MKLLVLFGDGMFVLRDVLCCVMEMEKMSKCDRIVRR
jgi:hypothetical protein